MTLDLHLYFREPIKGRFTRTFRSLGPSPDGHSILTHNGMAIELISYGIVICSDVLVSSYSENVDVHILFSEQRGCRLDDDISGEKY